MAKRRPQTDTNGTGEARTTQVTLPVLGSAENLPGGYIRENIDRMLNGPVATKRLNVPAMLTREEVVKFAALKAGLYSQNAKLANGSHVNSNADVIRYLIQQVDAP